jgi:hypothetical protein
MADYEREQFVEIPALRSMQDKSTEFIKRDGELNYAQNTRYDVIGAVRKSGGYEQIGNDLTSTSSTSTSTSTTTTSTSTSTTTTSTSTSTSTSTTTSTSTS